MRSSRIICATLFSRCTPLLQNSNGKADVAPSETEYKKLQAKLREVTADFEAANTECLYSAAEAENVRKQTKSSIEEAKMKAEEDFAKDMLNAADALEKTAKSAATCLAENPSLAPKIQKILEGVQLSYQVLNKVFKRHDVEKMNVAVGSKFDPEIEVSIFSCPVTEAVPEHHIAEVVKDGYLCRGKVLRQAQVGLGESPS